MSEKEKSDVLEGEILSRDGGKKDKDGKTPQYVSEKAVGIGVLIAVLLATGYFFYAPVKNWISGPPQDMTESKPAEKKPVVGEEPKTEPVAEDKTVAGEEPKTEPPTEAAEPEKAAASASNDLEKQIDDLKAKVAALEAQPKPEPATSGASEDRVKALEDEVAALKAELASRPAAAANETGTYAQAVAALATPLYQSQPFEGELERVRTLVLDMPALDQTTLAGPITTLSDFALTGVPNLETIRDHFEVAAIAALKVEGLPEDAGWWDKTWAHIKGLVVVRHTDGTSGSPLEEVINTAEEKLNRGDVEGATGLIKGLPANEGQAFADWITLAETRTSAVKAFQKLVAHVPRQTTKAKP